MQSRKKPTKTERLGRKISRSKEEIL